MNNSKNENMELSQRLVNFEKILLSQANSSSNLDPLNGKKLSTSLTKLKGREEMISQLHHSKESFVEHSTLITDNWASYILTLEFLNMTTEHLELQLKITHGKMKRGTELYLYNEQKIQLLPGKKEIFSIGKGDMTAYGIELTGRLLCLKDNGRNAILLHDDLSWYIPYKLAVPCEFRDESKLHVDLLTFPPRASRDYKLRKLILTYHILFPEN